MIKNKFILTQILFILLIFSGQVLAATPWTLDADRIETRDDEKIIEAFGNVYLFRLGNFLQADYAKLYTDTNWLYLKGNISAQWDNDFLEGEEAELDLDSNTGWLKNGQVFMADPHMYFTGELLEKTGENTYNFFQGTVTSCDDDTPPWSIKSSRGKITVGGYAGLWHPRFRVKDRPVFYSPYMFVPVKTERQSGFLFPDLSYESDYGANINLPYYHVIDEERDATLYTNYYSKRGLMLGLEYRHTPSLLTKGLWRADWMLDKEKHDTDETEPSKFQDDDLLRPNKNRYWFRAKYDRHNPGSGWSYKLDLDYVSDQNYLREFKSGQSGFKASRDAFLETFGRDIQDHDSLIRTNIFSASRYWNNIGLDARIVYSDNLRYKNHNLRSSLNPTIQRLPEINLDLFKTSLGSSPFDIEATSQAVHFWREYGTTATRVDVHPKLSLPLKSPYGVLTPRVGWKQTVYFIDRFENDPSGRNTDDKFQSRGMYDLNINAYSDIYRVFDLQPEPEALPENIGHKSWTRIKHSLRPEIDFDYIPEVSQDKRPRFDSTDRIEPREELTYSLSNVFTRRKDSVVSANQSTEPEIEFSYLDFFRLKFEQSYDFREARRTKDLNRYSRRPFSDLLTDIELNPGRFVSLRNKTWYSFYENRITEHEHSLRLIWPDKMSAWFSLDFLDEINEFKRRINQKTSIMKLGASFDFIRNWQFNLIYRRDMDTDQDLEKGLGIIYRHQCYSLELNITETDYDHKFEIRINLLNLGSIGG
ncbi:MAG: LPS-assembly protein LptD [Desulfonatronovibrio sp.]